MPSLAGWAVLAGFALFAIAAHTVVSSEYSDGDFSVLLRPLHVLFASYCDISSAHVLHGRALHSTSAAEAPTQVVLDAGRQLAQLTQQEYSGVPLLAAAELTAAAIVLCYGMCFAIIYIRMRDHSCQFLTCSSPQ